MFYRDCFKIYDFSDNVIAARAFTFLILIVVVVVLGEIVLRMC